MNKNTELNLLQNYYISNEYSKKAKIILFNGDTEKFLKTIPNESVQLIFTSPPYNIGKEYEKKIEINKYLETQKKTIEQLFRVLKDNGSICWQVGNYIEGKEIFPLDIFYYEIFKDLGMYLRNRIIWRFGHGLHSTERLSGRYETILWFTKSNNYIFNLDPIRTQSIYPGKLSSKGPNKGEPSGNPKGKNPSDVWEMLQNEWEESFWEIPNVKANHVEKTIHPCQFPVELVERCVLALTNEGDSVYDPYCGVGSALIAAIKNNRKAIGSEKEESYISIAKERIDKFFTGTLKTRPLGKPIHKPKGTEKVAQIPEQWKVDNSTIYYQGKKLE